MEGTLTYYIRASLSLKSTNKSICTPKITNALARAVRKATRLIPWLSWPLPVILELVEELAELVLDAVDEAVVDILRS